MIAQLGTYKAYDYYRKRTKLRITEITKPDGPIKFIRWDSQQSESNATPGGISVNQLGTVASVFSRSPNYPIHFDRLFSGGGNSRSALETLLACTPNFFISYPQKTNPYTGATEDKLKHIMWCPGEAHRIGEIETKEYKQVISEVELDIDFGDIGVTPGMLSAEFDTIEAKKIHTQMQVALIRIGNALDFKTLIAKNDRSIPVENKHLGELEGVIQSLDEVRILYNEDSKKMASFIDCIWFSNDFKYMPAIIEIEHSTGVTSGLTRMLKFKEAIPALTTNYTVVAPNDMRNKVVSEANSTPFRILRTRYMAYSTVRELYGLIQRYKLSNVVQRTFIEPFLENIVEDRL
jgi:type II restriction enzyme